VTGFSWRPIERGDVAEWLIMLTAVRDVDGYPDHVGEKDLLALFDLPDCDFAVGSIAAFAASTMVASSFLVTRPAADPAHQLRFEGAVHPAYRRRGLGVQVLDWVEQAAVPVHEKRHPGRPLTLEGRSQSGNAGHDALFGARGYRRVRWWHTMRMDLSGAPQAGPVPSGIEITGYTPDMLEDARQVRNEAFQDHWGSTRITAESWAHQLGRESFRPELSYVAYAGGQALGIVMSHEHETGTRDLYIDTVGTRRAGRNRGIATALLSRALAGGRAAGFGTSSLLVDGDSLTGAVGLYKRIGYTVDRTHLTQAKDLVPVR
jgi:ribosomal protein S18 acetylase RimI-like enzyme